MAMLEEYDWKGLSPNLIEWLEDMTQYWNLGRLNIELSASPPTSATSASGPGFKLAKDGSTWFLYIYTDSTDKWQKVQLSTVA